MSYEIEEKIKHSIRSAFWLFSFEDPKDKREVSVKLWKNPIILMILFFIFLSMIYIIYLGTSSMNLSQVIVKVIYILFFNCILGMFGISVKYAIIKNHFEEKYLGR